MLHYFPKRRTVACDAVHLCPAILLPVATPVKIWPLLIAGQRRVAERRINRRAGLVGNAGALSVIEKTSSDSGLHSGPRSTPVMIEVVVVRRFVSPFSRGHV